MSIHKLHRSFHFIQIILLNIKIVKTGETFEMEGEPNELASELLARISQKIGVQAQNIRLIAASKVVDSAKSLQDNGITEGMTCSLFIKKASAAISQLMIAEIKSQAQKPKIENAPEKKADRLEDENNANLIQTSHT